jgi:O-acetyl-ADP-ribose deacetylase (regulator of RNase III)
MIREVSGDILLTKAQVIAHGVAPNDHHQSGLALGLREQWPAMVKDFRHYCHESNPKPGTLWAWAGADGRRIVSLLTQDTAEKHNGRSGRAHLEHVNHALKALRTLAEKEGFASLALPRLATGVGGLEWKDVAPLVRQHLGDLDIPVYVYTTYRKGEAAAEA